MTQPMLPLSENGTVVFELFVQAGFCDFELASITMTLQAANKVRAQEFAQWRFVADMPGLVQGSGGCIVRASPAIADHFFADCMIVIGAEDQDSGSWMKRARAMRRMGRPVILLSAAATAFIKATKITTGAVTTHWRDAAVLAEAGDYPRLTGHMSEKTQGIITSAGSGYTIELIIGLIADIMTPDEVAELGNQLLIATIRASNTEQPKNIGDNTNLFDRDLTRVIQLMEGEISEPLSQQELSQQVGLSARHIERKFKLILNTSPAKFYKRLRAKRARAILTETQMNVLDVAIATGFSSTSSLSKALREQFGETCSQIRARRKVQLMRHH